MLTKVKAYSSWQSATDVVVPTMLVDDNGRAESDLIQVRNIAGLGPVKGAVNTSPLGSMDGSAYTGTSIGPRNIVLTIAPNPDWNTWTMEAIRRVIYLYFMPKLLTRLVFESDDMAPVEIYGYVESVEPNIFAKDGEMQVSVICPDPYFTAVDASVKIGPTTRDASVPVLIDYKGNIDIGINVQITRIASPDPTSITIQIGKLIKTYFIVTAGVSSTQYFIMNSIPGQKYVRNVNTTNGVITNLLSKVAGGSNWPKLEPGPNDFSVITDKGQQDWELTYFERFGGL